MNFTINEGKEKPYPSRMRGRGAESVLSTLFYNTDNEEKRMGYLGKQGNVCIERTADFYKLRTITARDNPECQNCIELPYCIASCKYARLRDNTKCMGRSGDGLTLEERALLDYYYDIQKAKLSSEK